jgi:hypothetical protein
VLLPLPYALPLSFTVASAKVPTPVAPLAVPPATAPVVPPAIAPAAVAGRITKRAKEYDDDLDDDFHSSPARTADRQQKKNRQSNTLPNERQRDDQRSQPVSAKDLRKANELISERQMKRKSMDPSKDDPTRLKSVPPLHLSQPDLPSDTSHFADSVYDDLNIPSKKKKVSFSLEANQFFFIENNETLRREKLEEEKNAKKRNRVAVVDSSPELFDVGSSSNLSLSPPSPTAAISTALRSATISAPPVPVPLPAQGPGPGPGPTFIPPPPSQPSAPTPAPARPRKQFSDAPPTLYNNPIYDTPLAGFQPVAAVQNKVVSTQPVALTAVPVTPVLQVPPNQTGPHFATSHTYQTTITPAHIPVAALIPPHYSAVPMPTAIGIGAGGSWTQYPKDAQMFNPSYFNHAQPPPWSRGERDFVPPLPVSVLPPPPPPPMTPGYLGSSSPATSSFQQLAMLDNGQYSDRDGRVMPVSIQSHPRDDRQANGYATDRGYQVRPNGEDERQANGYATDRGYQVRPNGEDERQANGYATDRGYQVRPNGEDVRQANGYATDRGYQVRPNGDDERQAYGYATDRGYQERPNVAKDVCLPQLAPPVPMPPPEPVVPPPPPVIAPTRRITKPTFYIARFEVPKDR